MVEDLFEETVARFTQYAVIQKSQERSIHPFDRELYETTLREKLSAFRKDIQGGYKTLIEATCEKEEKDNVPRTEAKAIKHIISTQKALNRLKNEDFSANLLKAEKPLFMVIGLSPEAIATLFDAAVWLQEEGRAEEARKSLRFLLLLAPHFFDLWQWYGISLIRLKKFDEAIEALEQALVLNKDSTDAVILLARALAEAGRKSEAISRIQALLDEATRLSDSGRYEILQAARYELFQFVPK